MPDRQTRARQAQETLDLLERGAYTNSRGDTVNLAEALQHARTKTLLYRPEEIDSLLKAGSSEKVLSTHQIRFEVTGETTLAAAQRLYRAGESHLLCLNFASAKNPGGGFLGGSQAQEESLARSSGLYACLLPQTAYYTSNRHCHTCLYTDHMIYSPDVPVFRDDAGTLLDECYTTAFITAPAVNQGAVARNEPHRLAEVRPVMASRIEKMLTLCHSHQHEVLVLGAWGCGVFQMDPAEVAELFQEQLQRPVFQSAFRQIVFAVYDPTPQQRFRTPFAQVFTKSD